MSLAQTVLEERWNEQAQALIELGGKLWNVQGMLGGEHLSLMKLVLPQLDLARAVGSIRQVQRARHPFAVGH